MTTHWDSLWPYHFIQPRILQFTRILVRDVQPKRNCICQKEKAKGNIEESKERQSKRKRTSAKPTGIQIGNENIRTNCCAGNHKLHEISQTTKVIKWKESSN